MLIGMTIEWNHLNWSPSHPVQIPHSMIYILFKSLLTSLSLSTLQSLLLEKTMFTLTVPWSHRHLVHTVYIVSLRYLLASTRLSMTIAVPDLAAPRRPKSLSEMVL